MESTIPAGAAGSSGSRAVGIEWRRVVVPVAGLMAVGTVLRLIGIGTKAYWQDEVGTIGVLNDLATLKTAQSTPPFYSLVAWPWAHVFGTTEIGLRSLSTVFTVALIPVAYLVGRQRRLARRERRRLPRRRASSSSDGATRGTAR